mmetsp:Transcript_61603/g.134926  ORF Transcript_61603/g.134926 Transcript_61603/m.134926 type:complete len:273 (+) Transcript_61603:422-1240(+)
MSRPEPLAKEHLHLRFKQLADSPAVFIPPSVQSFPLRGVTAGDVVAAILVQGFIVFRQGDPQVGAVDLLLHDDHGLSIEELLRFLLAQQSIALRQGFAVGQVQDMWRGRKLEETHGAHFWRLSPIAFQQVFRFLEVMDGQNFLEAFGQRGQFQRLLHATHGAATTSESDAGMIRALRHALLAVPGALREVNANSTFGTEGQLQEGDAISFAHVGAVQNQAFVTVLGHWTNLALKFVPARELVLADPHEAWGGLHQLLRKGALTGARQTHQHQ